MTDTPNLGLPFIAAGQAQKHVTHNEALRVLDSLVQLAVLDITRSAPPASPADGQRHIVGASPTGAWAGKAHCIAVYQDSAWAFLAPRSGWTAWSIANSGLYVFDGATWTDQHALPYDNLARLGVNTTASSPNLLAVRSNAALFAALATADSGSGDMRVQLSKEATAKTASLVFSDAYSGRAEFGLTGDDDFHIKVSPDGASWFEALRVARASGKVSFPASGGPREVLAAARTYYVRADGSDANDGLANTSGGAFLTVQKAIDALCALDLSIYQATIQIANGTYGGAILLKAYLGALPPIIQGNGTTPANVLISTTGDCITNAAGGIWQVNDLKIATTGGHGLRATSGGTIRFQNLDFGAVSGLHILPSPASSIVATGNYTVSGGAQIHVMSNGFVSVAGVTVTYPNAISFSLWNFGAGRGGVVDAFGMGFTNPGNVTGQRYSARDNGVLFTNSGSASYFPGTVAGASVTGGQYI